MGTLRRRRYPISVLKVRKLDFLVRVLAAVEFEGGGGLSNVGKLVPQKGHRVKPSCVEEPQFGQARTLVLCFSPRYVQLMPQSFWRTHS